MTDQNVVAWMIGGGDARTQLTPAAARVRAAWRGVADRTLRRRPRTTRPDASPQPSLVACC